MSMPATPPLSDRKTWQELLDTLRLREKAHTREGGAVAAARRRLPMVEVDCLRQGDPVFKTYWSTGRGCEAMAPSYGLLDMTVYGRQEEWEESPEGWPQRFRTDGDQFRFDGRPTLQWSRLVAGRDDDLGATAPAGSKRHCH
jgi:predicted dithiol-disulfide oxidoreductase (DUF899 family)